MCHSFRQRGFSMVTTIFILVVLTALGAFMVTMSGVQNATLRLDVQGARAYQGALAGVEWGIHQAFNNTVPTCGGAPSTPTTNTFAPTGGALNGFSLTVICEYTTHQERSDIYNIYYIDAQATLGTFGTPAFVSRRARVAVTDAP